MTKIDKKKKVMRINGFVTESEVKLLEYNANLY